MAFVQNPAVKALLDTEGVESLPAIFVDGALHLKGRYLTDEERETLSRAVLGETRTTQPESVMRLLERLRDSAFTNILLITLPEATPVHEAAALQEDLRRAHIEPFAWVINQSLLHNASCDPLLQRREESEHR